MSGSSSHDDRSPTEVSDSPPKKRRNMRPSPQVSNQVNVKSPFTIPVFNIPFDPELFRRHNRFALDAVRAHRAIGSSVKVDGSLGQMMGCNGQRASLRDHVEYQQSFYLMDGDRVITAATISMGRYPLFSCPMIKLFDYDDRDGWDYDGVKEMWTTLCRRNHGLHVAIAKTDRGTHVIPFSGIPDHETFVNWNGDKSYAFLSLQRDRCDIRIGRKEIHDQFPYHWSYISDGNISRYEDTAFAVIMFLEFIRGFVTHYLYLHYPLEETERGLNYMVKSGTLSNLVQESGRFSNWIPDIEYFKRICGITAHRRLDWRDVIRVPFRADGGAFDDDGGAFDDDEDLFHDDDDAFPGDNDVENALFEEARDEAIPPIDEAMRLSWDDMNSKYNSVTEMVGPEWYNDPNSHDDERAEYISPTTELPYLQPINYQTSPGGTPKYVNRFTMLLSHKRNPYTGLVMNEDELAQVDRGKRSSVIDRLRSACGPVDNDDVARRYECEQRIDNLIESADRAPFNWM